MAKVDHIYFVSRGQTTVEDVALGSNAAVKSSSRMNSNERRLLALSNRNANRIVASTATLTTAWVDLAVTRGQGAAAQTLLWISSFFSFNIA